MTFEDRLRIEKAFTSSNESLAAIAKKLQVTQSILYDELRRLGLHGGGEAYRYSAEAAQKDAEAAQRRRSRKVVKALSVFDPAKRKELEQLLTTTRLPMEQVAKKLGIDRQTLYNELHLLGLCSNSAYRYSAEAAQEAWEKKLSD